MEEASESELPFEEAANGRLVRERLAFAFREDGHSACQLFVSHARDIWGGMSSVFFVLFSVKLDGSLGAV